MKLDKLFVVEKLKRVISEPLILNLDIVTDYTRLVKLRAQENLHLNILKYWTPVVSL
jgi:hypothetical protein